MEDFMQVIRTVAGVALLAIVFGAKHAGSERVTITKFEVPPHVEIHKDARLTCEHDLKPGRLAIVQWFHNGEEFYRFTAYNSEPKWVPPDSELLVNMNNSSETAVVLQDVDLNTTGTFECAVMSEEPDFSEAKRKANLTVVVIPTTKPIIEPAPSEDLRPGSEINLNCTSAPSIPAATMEWHINDEEVVKSRLKTYQPEKESSGLYVSRLGLYFKIEKEDYMRGAIRLRCTAKISTLYAKWDEREHSHSPSLMNTIGEPPAQPAIGGNLVRGNGGTSVALWYGQWIALIFLGLTQR